MTHMSESVRLRAFSLPELKTDNNLHIRRFDGITRNQSSLNCELSYADLRNGIAYRRDIQRCACCPDFRLPRYHPLKLSPVEYSVRIAGSTPKLSCPAMGSGNIKAVLHR